MVTVHIGSWERDAVVAVDGRWPEDAVGIARNWALPFTLPEAVRYDVRLRGNRLYIGPVIALIAFREEEEATPEALAAYANYGPNDGGVRGFVYICADRGVRIESRTIEGYYCDSAAGAGKAVWKSGTFPYPSAVFRRAMLRADVYDHLRDATGNRLFNSDYADAHFDKREQWRRLALDAGLREHLPHTRPLDSLKTLHDMLDRYGAVYLKPAASNKANGIVKAVKAGSGCDFLYPDRTRAENAVRIRRAGTPREVGRIVRRLQSKRAYIVQQAIAMKRYEDRGIDFRVIVQKNARRQWQCNGWIARFGKKGSVITNFTKSGYALPGRRALQTAFLFDERQALRKEQEIMELCIRACEQFERGGGHYGDLGLDVMLDEHGKPWILEINTNHFHDFPLFALQDVSMYRTVCAAPIEYAASLATSSWENDAGGNERCGDGRGDGG